MKYEELKQHVMEIFYNVVENIEENDYEKGLLNNIEHCMRDGYYEEEEEVNQNNWEERFEDEYGYWPDEHDYRMAFQVREYKQKHNIK